MAGVRRVLRWLGVVLALVLAAVVATAFVPLSRSGLDVSTPAPLTTPDAAIAAIAGQVAAEEGVKPACHSRLVAPAGKPKGVIVLLHGLGSCPAQMSALAAVLADDGYAVYLPLLPEHGRIGGDGGSLNGLTEERYRAFGDRTVDIARGFGVPVSVLGISAGANVAAWIGEYRADVEVAVVVSPALGLGHVPSFVTTGAMNLFKRLPSMGFPWGRTLPNTYDGLSTRPLAATFNFGRALIEAAGSRRPAAKRVVVVLNEHDHTYSNDLALTLAGRMQAVVQALPAALELPGDCIDPQRPGARVDAVYPLLVSLVEDLAV
jgi:pimeloyl-ACP methyl ester carboxylesterase